MLPLPQTIRSESELDELLSRPSEALIASLSRGSGDLLVLGAGGKMGPTLARMARRAFDAGGRSGEVIAVSRYSEPRIREQLEAHGVRTQVADLLEPDELARLPDAPDVVFMAGRKFGSSGAEHLTWAMNAYLPGRVAERYRDARMIVFSTGNVYPFTAPASGGATEETLVGPVGEYAQSCLGRERVFQYFSRRYGTPAAIIRLAYAVELRYGVLLDLATSIWSGAPIELAVGHVNLIWQGDACDLAMRALEHATSPPLVLNLTGPEVLAVRWLAERLGGLLGKQPTFQGSEAPTALLVNDRRALGLLGRASVPLDAVLRWVADWVRAGGRSLDKPTHFEVRNGRF